MIVISEYLKREMTKRGLNKTQFARQLDMHPTQLDRLLKADSLPRTATIKKVAEKLGCSESDLLSLSCESSTVSHGNFSHQWPEGLHCGSCYELMDAAEAIGAPMTLVEIAKKLCELDEERYHPTKDSAGTEEQWMDLFAAYPDSSNIFYFVKDKKQIEIIGDWSIVLFSTVPIDDKLGLIKESEIRLGNEEIAVTGGACDLVILSMGVAKRYNTMQVRQLLISSFEKAIREIPEETIIKNLFVNAFSLDFAFFSGLGFVKRNPNAQEKEDGEGRRIPVLFQMKNECRSNKEFAFPGRKQE